MDERRVVRYSEAFKRQVVRELEDGTLDSLEQARRRYGIGGTATVTGWLRRFGRNDLMAKVVRVESADEKKEIDRLRRQVRDLEHALAQTRMKELLAEAHFDIICEDRGLDAEAERKKADAALSKRRAAPDREKRA
jgi:transposase